MINEVLTIPSEKNISWFQKFKEYPASATITLLEKYLDKYKGTLNISVHNYANDFKQFARFLLARDLAEEGYEKIILESVSPDPGT